MDQAETRIAANLRKGALEFCVLALLSGERHHGIDLAVRLKDAGLIASEGTLYPLLLRLRTARFVQTHWEESPQGPVRSYCTLTEAGRRQLEVFHCACRPEKCRTRRRHWDNRPGTSPAPRPLGCDRMAAHAARRPHTRRGSLESGRRQR